MSHFVQTPLGSHFRSFEAFGALPPGLSESSAGIGLAIVVLTVLSVCAARKLRCSGPDSKASRSQFLLRWVPWGLLLIFMAEVGAVQDVRYLAPYYVFFFPSLLINPGHGRLVRRVWWQRAALVCLLTAVGLLVVNADRPLFPAMTIASKLRASHPQSKTIASLSAAYAAPYALENVNRQVNEHIPPTESVLGYATTGNGQLEPGLWMPLGSRRVERVLRQDNPAQLADRGIRYVVVEGQPYPELNDIRQWMATYHATLIASFILQEKSSSGDSSPVYLLRLNP